MDHSTSQENTLFSLLHEWRLYSIFPINTDTKIAQIRQFVTNIPPKKSPIVYTLYVKMVGDEGLEPPRLAATGSKPVVATITPIPQDWSGYSVTLRIFHVGNVT